MAYTGALQRHKDKNLVREMSVADSKVVEVLAQALRDHPAPPPPKPPVLCNSLQGNLAEFLVWDVGERHWRYYSRGNTKAANASSPWRNSSDPGIDILAVCAGESLKLMLIEVKSSVNDGTQLIVGDRSCLQSDFRHMFEGEIQNRLSSRIGGLVSEYFYAGQQELALRIRGCLGDTPANCTNIHIAPTLVCSEPSRHAARMAKLDELRDWLKAEGWPDDKISIHLIELESLKDVLKKVISQVCPP